MPNNNEVKLKFFDKMVDVLVDLYDPTEDEFEETKDDMLQVVSMIFESLELDVEFTDNEKVVFSVVL
tara:strand:- start:7313 stop:7513 length:201 start_codon:yes stop_codon:yes gene_type:complete